MLYENYQNRIKKIADVLRLMLRMWPLVLLSFLMTVSAITAFFITKGMIISFECQSSVAYGEPLSYKANAFLSKTYIEYSDGSGEWSNEAPIMPGEYKARAVGKGVFGSKKTGDSVSFTIEKKEITVHSKDGTVHYGEAPVISADLAYGDALYCDEFEFEEIFIKNDAGLSNNTYELCVGVIPVKSAIVIKDKNGNDVTSAYVINVNREELKVIPRDITVTVRDASKTYDGTKLSFDGYELSVGELAAEDLLYAYFDKSIINVGSVENTPRLVIVNEDGTDVTLCYNITVVKGMLTVEKRPLIITTGGGEFDYDGTSHTVENFEVSTDTPIAVGQTLSVYWSGITDAGEHKNVPTVTVMTQSYEDVTDNYSVFFNAGTIKIKPMPITIVTSDASVIYNGYDYYFSSFGCSIKSGKLFDRHFIQMTEGRSEMDAGTYVNDTAVTVWDYYQGKEVTHNYDITYEYGTVEIGKRPITVVTGSETWVYDGEAHYNTGISIRPGSNQLAYNDEIRVTEKTDITDAGSIRNHLSFQIVREAYGDEKPSLNIDDVMNPGTGGMMPKPDAPDEDRFVDVSYNYEITVIYGTLVVEPRPIILKPVDAKKVYDGTPLVATELEVSPMSPYTLVEGHSATEFKTSGSITDVGAIANYASDIVIYDSSGIDVTRNYSIGSGVGTLTVIPREILVETGSASKKYDGTPLTNGDFGVSAESPNQLVEGHRLYVTNIGEITKVGMTENICSLDETRVYDASGRDVTTNYLVNYSYGILEVYEDMPGGSGGSGGGGLSESGDIGADQGDSDGNSPIALRLKDEKSGYLYLKLKSFGGYTGKGWNEATEYSKKIDGIYSANYLTALALGQTSYKLAIEVLGSQYFLPYYLSLHDTSNHDVQSSDVMYVGDASKIYSVSYKDYDYKTPFKLPQAYEEFENAYRSFVYSQYLIIDEETREYMEEIIDSQGFVGKDIETILRAAKYIQNSARYTLDYDRALDNEENVAIAFLDSYRAGICQHYATAATLLFRAMGIPARYTVGYVTATTAGEWVEVYGDQAHAWVEVYIDGMGWIEVEVTGGGEFGHNGSGGEPEKETITVKPTYRYKKYDGKPLYAEDLIDLDTILKELVDRGYYFSVSVTGEQLEVGKSESVPANFRLYDPRGKDVTDEYNIVYENGILEVIAPDITIVQIELYQLQKYYDGKPISFEKGDYVVKGVPSSVKLSLKLNISLTEVGYLTLSDLNENVDEYVTFEIEGGDPEYYKIVFVAPAGTNSVGYIPIRVDARAITLTASSATKEYDGDYLTSDEYYITKGSLCEGHTLIATLNGSIKRPGEEINMITSVIITDSLGNDVTYNYNITAVDGILTVTE